MTNQQKDFEKYYKGLTDKELQKEMVDESRFTPANQAARDAKQELIKEVDRRNKKGSKIV